MAAEAEVSGAGTPVLTALDWVVIAAATVCLALLLVWALQSRAHKPDADES